MVAGCGESADGSLLTRWNVGCTEDARSPWNDHL